jgi:hypothetical protein
VPPLYFGGSSRAGRAGGRAARRRVPDLGRTAGRRTREGRVDPRSRRGAGTRRPIRHPAAHHLPRLLGAGLANRRSAGGRPGRGDGARRAGRSGPQPVRGAAADGGPARGEPAHQVVARRPQPGDSAQPVVRRRTGARRCRHRAGRQSHRGGRPDRRVRRRRDRRVHLLRLSASGGAVLVRRGCGPHPARAWAFGRGCPGHPGGVGSVCRVAR